MSVKRGIGRGYPACPKCGDLCGRLARVCASCGTHLYDDVTNDGRRRRSPATPPPGEETQPREGKVN